MPNYNYVIDSSYKPYSLQEMLMPLEAYKEAYNQAEEKYLALSKGASTFKYLAENTEDGSKARETYLDYAKELEAQAKDFEVNGLNINNGSALTALRRRYASDITPIENAFLTRRAQAEEQRKALAANPTLMFSRRADATSLDDYINNPELGYEQYSGALLAQQVGNAASAMAKQLKDNITTGHLDPYTKTWVEEHGFSPAEVLTAIENPDSPGASRVLNTIVEQAVQSSNIPGWNDANILKQAYSYARQGLWQAVGESKIHTFADYGAQLAAQLANQKALARYNKELEGATTTSRHAYIPPQALRTQKEMDTIATNINNAREFLKEGYLSQDTNGKYKLTDKGIDVLRSVITEVADPIKGEFRDAPGTKNAFYRMITDISGDNNIKSKIEGNRIDNSTRYQIGEKFAQFVKDNENNAYDVNRATEYSWHLTPEQGQSLVKAMLAMQGSLGIMPVEFQTSDGGIGRFTNKKTRGYSTRDLEGFEAVDIRPSAYGVTVLGKLNGEMVRVKVPEGTGGEGVVNRLVELSNERTKTAKVLNMLESIPANKLTSQDYEDYINAKKTYDDIGDAMAQYLGILTLESKAEPQQVTIRRD